jgi:hypothetical protein
MSIYRCFTSHSFDDQVIQKKIKKRKSKRKRKGVGEEIFLIDGF